MDLLRYVPVFVLVILGWLRPRSHTAARLRRPVGKYQRLIATHPHYHQGVDWCHYAMPLSTPSIDGYRFPLNITVIDSSLFPRSLVGARVSTHWVRLYDTVLPQGCSIDISSALGAKTKWSTPILAAFVPVMSCEYILILFHILEKSDLQFFFRNVLICSQNLLKHAQRPNLKCIKKIQNPSTSSKTHKFHNDSTQ